MKEASSQQTVEASYEMAKVKIEANTQAYPMPVCLVGANVKGKPTFMTAAWFSKVNVNPPMFMVSLENPRYTAEGIKENKVFSINFPCKSLVEKTDYCGMVSGRKTDKSGVFKVEYGEFKAPMVGECPVCLELKLKETVELPDSRLFIGEVVTAYADEKYLTNGKLDVPKTEQFSLIESPAAVYMGSGQEFEKAFSVGKKLLK
ncbi:MAG: flavin reductase family protein [Candidatus Bathyarchaeia archaeon]